MRKVLLFLLTATLAFGQAGRPPVNNLNQIPTRNFSDLQNKPNTVAGYGITDVPDVALVGQHSVQDNSETLTVPSSVAGDTLQKLFSSVDHTGSGSYVRSTTSLLKDFDNTCVPIYTGGSFNFKATAVSPRHVIIAHHVGMSNGTEIRFVTNSNVTITRTLTSHQQVGSSDIDVGLLSSDLPNTITPAKVLPNAGIEATQTGRGVIYADQNLRIYLGELVPAGNTTFGAFGNSSYAHKVSFGHITGPGDSSTPIFFILDNQLIFLGPLTSSGTFASIAYNYAGINAVMTSLGGGYQPTQYRPILPTPQAPKFSLVPSLVYDSNKKLIFDNDQRQILDATGNPLASWGDNANTINIYDTTTLKIGPDTVLVGDDLNDYVRAQGFSSNEDNLSELTDFPTARTNLGLGTAATKNTGTASGNIPILDGAGKVNPSVLPASSTTFKGVWNANTNSPTIVSSTGTLGWFYLVSVAGATAIDGLSSWAVGDQIIFDGSVWKQVPAAASVTSVAGHTGAVTLAASDIASGTMATARLGSGTASNKTVLYGDQTYKFPQQFYDSAGTPKLALDSTARKGYYTDGTTVVFDWSSTDLKSPSFRTLGGHAAFTDTGFTIAGSDGNSQINVEPGAGHNGIKLAEAINGNYVFQVDPDTGQTTIGGNTTDSGKLSLFNPAGTFTVTIAADNVTANRTIQEPNASGTHALTTDIPTLASNVASFLADPTSAKLRLAITDEDGTGALMFVGSTVYQPRPVVTTVAFSSTVTPAVGTTNATTTYIVGALTNNITIGAPTGTPIDGQVLKFRLLQDSTGGRSVTWNSAFVFGTDITAAMEPNAANAVWRRAFEYNAATAKWECVGLVRGF